MPTKKIDETQFEQSEEFHRVQSAMKKILAVPKEELARREQEYRKKSKRHGKTK